MNQVIKHFFAALCTVWFCNLKNGGSEKMKVSQLTGSSTPTKW
jgi:hypothetical protein